ncbi:MAG: tetratricopeptide repeat protein, partial [Acidobacteriaceae bacterium]|nr:tetratricopeptide repeat protein [Acidobacteriaceae bacterium]
MKILATSAAALLLAITTRGFAEPAPQWMELRSQATAATGRGDYVEAEALFESARRALPADHLHDSAVLLNELGLVHHAMWRVADAERDFRGAADLAARVGPDAASDQAVALTNLAALMNDRGQVVEAEQLFRESRSALEAASRADTGTLVLVLAGLALNLQSQGRGAEAR